MDAECATFVLGWAPGSQTDEMPEEAGFAIGTGVGAFKYYTLQIHYDNPTGIANQTDSSGFEFWYTPTLRPNDLGVLTTGIVNFTIPASTSTYTLDGGGCPSACTKNFSQPITLWRNAFHMHSLGKNMTTRHIRNNAELEPLGSRPFWDFNHQSLSRIDGNKNGTRVFLPGDQLITKCSYDSSGRNVSTTYGESTSNEMCFNFLLYWPRMKQFEYCLTDEVGGVCGNNTAVERVSADLGNFQPYIAQCDSDPTLSPATAQDSGASSTFMSPAKHALVLWVAVLILLM
ncbi:hypothetical protein HK097_003775 [Rhizophlyctis rosea]|uniref:Copper type II ascorbate-dependent monooxygenase C-terminal domain-containing protein n=1 Tax=Rhizophlyctis rosea TaxID=64517 RepID=A0AAD5WX21_9FUNG|nr:hypothetical protein HK097_003775 [Rhizophlyctis rosea]